MKRHLTALALLTVLPGAHAELEWLSLPSTTGMTFQEACQTFPQYRPSTEEEVQELLASFGFPITELLGYRQDLSQPLASFNNYLGLNMAGAGPAYGFAGTIGDAAGAWQGYHPVLMAAPRTAITDFEPSHVVSAVSYQSLGGMWLVSSLETTVAVREDVAFRNLGHFMVREAAPQAHPFVTVAAVSPIPELPVHLLLGVGLAGLAFARLRT